MTVDDVFNIKGRGSVVTGQLQGNGQLTIGDTLLCDGQRWQVSGIEEFGRTVRTAVPGENVGILLSSDLPAVVLRGRMIQFEPSAGAQPDDAAQPGTPQFTVLGPKKQRRWRK